MVLFKKRCLDIAKAAVLSNSWMCPCLQTKMYPGLEFLTALNIIFLSNIATKLVEIIWIYISYVFNAYPEEEDWLWLYFIL